MSETNYGPEAMTLDQVLDIAESAVIESADYLTPAEVADIAQSVLAALIARDLLNEHKG